MIVWQLSYFLRDVVFEYDMLGDRRVEQILADGRKSFKALGIVFNNYMQLGAVLLHLSSRRNLVFLELLLENDRKLYIS